MSGTEVSVRLPDDRKLAGTLYGDSSLKNVVVYFHGFPGSRKEAIACHDVASRLGLSILAFDRPGIGESSLCPEMKITNFAEDVEYALNHLAIATCSVLAISGGTPYGLAVAALCGSRVTKCAIVSGIGDVSNELLCKDMNKANRSLLAMARTYPKLGSYAVGSLASMWRTFPLSAALWFSSVLPKVDLKIIRKPHVSNALSSGMTEALRPGIKGVLGEFQRLLQPWPENFFVISAKLKIWHGKLDTYVPPAMATALANKILGSELVLVEQGGHFMIFDMMSDVLEWCRDTTK